MTRPIDDLLPLPLEPLAVPYMNLYHDALHELVCFGTHILANCLRHNRNQLITNQTSIAAPLLFRHILELLDAVSIQIKSGIIVPCKVQLRAALEAYLSLKYLLENNSEERAACFFLIDYYRRLNQCKKYMPGTPEHNSFLRDFKESALDYNEEWKLEEARARDVHEQLATSINKPQYSRANKEYLKLTVQNTKNLDLKWYALYSGPKNVYRLSIKVRHFKMYDDFYKSWSNPTHGTELWLGALVVGDDGKGHINQLRNVEEAHVLTMETILLGLLTMHEMAQKVVPKELSNIIKWTIQYRNSHTNLVDSTRLDFGEHISLGV